MPEIIKGNLKSQKPWRVGVVTALFNSELTLELERGALSTLEKNGSRVIARVQVPGAVEVPLAAKALLAKGDCDAVVALGLVIRGETAHFDYVCNAVERGCSQLQLEFNKPVAFGVLTTENREQAQARCGGRKGNKGAEAAEVALEMLDVLDQITNG